MHKISNFQCCTCMTNLSLTLPRQIDQQIGTRALGGLGCKYLISIPLTKVCASFLCAFGFCGFFLSFKVPH